ncbi:unnamed protein product [Ambrosiozyma monospora]|uniref:Unnamed protein product n=1 Tax=Ambrosiozyma monospora TaxID=43982 RepID=A0ACB5T3Z4_AMBMO|nr:unnamed protein product [Ambrosiozyma monospora]
MVLLHFNIRGHNVNSLIGGATGSVGDPSGRTTERDVMAQETRLTNVERISGQLVNFFKQGLSYSTTRNPLIESTQAGIQTLRNNFDWWKDIGMLDFLARYGRFIRVNQMLARDSVKSRLGSEQGLGFNEFTYQILQAFDFYHLNKNCGVDIQVGGNDQYGNIVAGVDLITRLKKQEGFNKDKECFGLTVPLLTTSNGVKFGKSAGNAIFISKELTPSYGIYQFMYNTTDEDVKRFLYKFSLLPTSLIDKVIEKHDANKKLRIGQKLLAIEMCDLIHGDGEGFNNFIISEVLFSKDSIDSFNADEILHAFKLQNMVTSIPRDEIEHTSVGNLLYSVSNGAKSKSEYRRMIKGGSVYVGNDKTTKFKSFEDPIDLEKYLIEEKLLLLRVGKQYHIIEVV